MAAYFINETLIPIAGEANLLLVHPHAQRTGGKTIRNNLVAAFGQDRVYSTMYLPNAKRWRRLTESDLRPYRAYSDIANFVDLRLSRPVLAIGVVRDPVDRAVSLYHYVRRHESHVHHALAMRATLEDFYRLGSARDASYFRNVQCRRICSHADARLALIAIRTHYIGVGLTDQMDVFLEALANLFGWPQTMRRPASPSSYAAEITPAFRAMVFGDNQEDWELFQVLSNGPPYRAANQSLARRMKTWGTRARDFTLTVAQKLAARRPRPVKRN